VLHPSSFGVTITQIASEVTFSGLKCLKLSILHAPHTQKFHTNQNGGFGCLAKVIAASDCHNLPHGVYIWMKIADQRCTFAWRLPRHCFHVRRQMKLNAGTRIPTARSRGSELTWQRINWYNVLWMTSSDNWSQTSCAVAAVCMECVVRFYCVGGTRLLNQRPSWDIGPLIRSIGACYVWRDHAAKVQLYVGGGNQSKSLDGVGPDTTHPRNIGYLGKHYSSWLKILDDGLLVFSQTLGKHRMSLLFPTYLVIWCGWFLDLVLGQCSNQ
jgi:hypothetical protein